jgi:hypothetical protein
MIKETAYWPDWQKNRIKFILSKYSEEFFKDKTILELGAHNGYIGAYFESLGSKVHCVEGRQINVDRIKKDYPQLSVELANLDTNEWKWGKWDIIINFGLYYHLEHFHKEHLENCINNCDLMFFESVIFDSDDSEIYFRNEHGNTQSLTDIGGSPSTSYVEDIFSDKNVKYTKYSDSSLNGHDHHYNWIGANSKKLDQFARRFWIIKK